MFDDLGFFEATFEEVLDEVFGGVDNDNFAGVHDGEAVAEDFGFVHVVGGEDDGEAGFADGLDEFPEVATGLGVEAGGGFVEEEDFGAVDEGGGDGEALFLATGEVFNVGGGFVGELDFFEEGEGVNFEAVEAGEHFELFSEGEFFDKGGGLELDADDGFDLFGVFGDVDAVDEDLATGDGAESFHHFEGGGFAGAVGAEDAEDFAGVNGEGDVFDGFFAFVGFGEVGDGDEGGG